jgi:hypothetical protein
MLAAATRIQAEEQRIEALMVAESRVAFRRSRSGVSSRSSSSDVTARSSSSGSQRRGRPARLRRSSARTRHTRARSAATCTIRRRSPTRCSRPRRPCRSPPQRRGAGASAIAGCSCGAPGTGRSGIDLCRRPFGRTCCTRSRSTGPSRDRRRDRRSLRGTSRTRTRRPCSSAPRRSGCSGCRTSRSCSRRWRDRCSRCRCRRSRKPPRPRISVERELRRATPLREHDAAPFCRERPLTPHLPASGPPRGLRSASGKRHRRAT